ELASWLMKNVGKTQTESFLKLPIVSTSQIKERTQTSYHNSRNLLERIDELPTGPGWSCDMLTVTGDKLDEDKKPMVEELELWRRDPVDCVRELLGNPTFRDHLKYAPEHVFLDKHGEDRVYDEAWTADWWWKIQVSLSAESPPLNSTNMHLC
ncbi:hypothetical protein PLICRDRAFT_119771, partial [Plicaturopsis crispa FD-325 SS-3]